ncbi:MAG TPA: AAA family ATPase [Candidatus Polarisedimenticolaceae bacterium]|nr:AAA family ATPase [Candidatus Polarisedimenticolaceae bacterium]
MSQADQSHINSPKPNVIGVAGYFGAGKDKFAEMLKQQLEARGFKVGMISSGDLIRQYVRDNDLGDPADRDVLRKTVDEVGAQYGYTYWLEQSIDQASRAGIDILLYPGLRQAVEANFLHDRGDIILTLDAPLEVRYQRAQQRGRAGDDVDFETFKANEEAERAGTAQQIDAVTQAADTTVLNNGSLEQLEQVAAAIAQTYPRKPEPRYNADAKP